MLYKALQGYQCSEVEIMVKQQLGQHLKLQKTRFQNPNYLTVIKLIYISQSVNIIISYPT